MLDINLIINHSSDIKNKLLSRGYELSLNKLEDLYFRRKDIIKKKEDLAANKNQISDQFKTCKDESEREKLRTSSENLENEIQLNKDQLLEIENNYNKSELEMFRVFYEEYGEEKLLLGATKRLHDGYEAYRNIRDGED